MAINIEKPYVESEYDPIYDPFTDEFQRDPFTAYRRLRNEAPVYYNEKWDFYALSRFDDVRAALKDHESLLNFQGVDIDDFEQEQSGYPGMIPNIDNPRHDQLRSVVQRSFMPRTIKGLTEEVRKVCDGLIDGFAGRREVDLSDEFAWPIPFEVFYNFFGMPHGKIREQFVEWTHGIKHREPGTPELTDFARESSRELREYLAELLRERRRNPQDDVLTRIVQAEIDGEPLAPEEFDYAAEAVGVAFALYLGGVETTAGQISTLFEQLARHPEQQRALHEDPTLIPRAVEESLRYRTIFQVTARTTSREIEVDGVSIPKGKRVFLILGSANRDESKFENPDEFDIHRPPAPHLGFGEGLHGCLGNPLARLEATVALEQMVARGGMFELAGDPERYVTTPNAYVFDRVPVRFLDAPVATEPRNEEAPSAAAASPSAPMAAPARANEIAVRVAKRIDAAEGVALLTLTPVDGQPLPDWSPGAHIDVVMNDILERQYSLCGDPRDRSSYTIGVLKEERGRGGSRHMHEEASEGSIVKIRGPRNHFELVDSERYLFIAGGIGITPIAAMAREVHRRGKPWRMIYCGRRLETMALREEFGQYGDRVTFWPRDTHGRISLPDVLQSPREGTAVYTCGPAPFTEAIEEICEASWPRGSLHVERFTPKQFDDSENTEFEVELAQRGYRLTVPKDRSVLDTLEAAGVHVLSSCGEGTCGTCDTAVLAGEVDHRDSVLTKEEQDRNDCMMVCVSRAKCPKLVLNL